MAFLHSQDDQTNFILFLLTHVACYLTDHPRGINFIPMQVIKAALVIGTNKINLVVDVDCQPGDIFTSSDGHTLTLIRKLKEWLVFESDHIITRPPQRISFKGECRPPS